MTAFGACDLCPHPGTEHDGMGDCRHADGRTATGFCGCRAPDEDAPSLDAWTTWSTASNTRYGANMMAAFRAGHRIGRLPARRRSKPSRPPAEAAYIVWAAKNDNTRYGSLNSQAFIAGFEVAVAGS